MIDDTKPAATTGTTANNTPQERTPTTQRRPPATALPAVRKTAAKRAPADTKPIVAETRKTTRSPAATPKPAPAKKATPVTKPAAEKKPAKPVKAKKVKLVRDSFTMPETEYAVIALLKKRCLAAGVSAKKSEILRAAVAGLAKLSDASVIAALGRLEVIKTGRPAKGSK